MPVRTPRNMGAAAHTAAAHTAAAYSAAGTRSATTSRISVLRTGPAEDAEDAAPLPPPPEADARPGQGKEAAIRAEIEAIRVCVSEIKSELASKGVSTQGLLEKSDFVKLLVQTRLADAEDAQDTAPLSPAAAETSANLLRSVLDFLAFAFFSTFHVFWVTVAFVIGAVAFVFRCCVWYAMALLSDDAFTGKHCVCTFFLLAVAFVFETLVLGYDPSYFLISLVHDVVDVLLEVVVDVLLEVLF